MTPPRTATHNADQAALDALAEVHTGWRIWRSKGSPGNPGAFYATRRRVLTEAEAEAEVPATLGADTVQQLAQKLAADRDREAGA